jgi:hypothetical protein
MMKKRKNEPSKWEIELMSILAIGFVFETVRELMEMLDLEDVKNKKEDEESLIDWKLKDWRLKDE